MAVEGAILPPIFNGNDPNGVPLSPARFRSSNLNSSPSTSLAGIQNSNTNNSSGNVPNSPFQQTNVPQPGAPPGAANQVNMVAYLPRPAYRFKPQLVANNTTDIEGYGRRLRRNMAQVRRHIDCVASVLNYLENRSWQDGSANERPFIHPHLLYSTDSYPPNYCPDKPIDCVTTKFVRAAMNKVKCPIYDVCWTPEGRRLITGASSGEFTLWNGTAFNFETILQAHDSAVRAMKWSRNDTWMVTADHDGYVKYWQANMNNVTMFQAHKEAVRSLRCCLTVDGIIKVVDAYDKIKSWALFYGFCPGDTKFATASDDGTVRVWDFMRCHEERILRGHGSDVRCVDWHPTKSLLVSGSRDSQQPVKLWDPKSSQCLATLHDHKNAVMAVQWNDNGNWMISASRDHLIKLYDIRMMKEVATFRGHKKEVTSLSWHPIHEGLFVSGGADGAMMFWLVGNEREVGLMETAHEQAVWCLKWHPLGHILASGSNDNNTKFWTRNKPGDLLEDFYGMVGNNPYDQHSVTIAGASAVKQPAAVPAEDSNEGARPVASHGQNAWDRRESTGGGPISIPGMGLGDEVVGNLHDNAGGGIPGLGGNMPPGLGGMDIEGGQSGRKTLLKQPPPKKAQRQFERTWNVSSQYVPDFEEPPMVMDPDYSRKMKPSLLGTAPPGMGMGMGGPMDMPMGGPMPPGGPGNQMHMNSGPPNMSNWSSPPIRPPMEPPNMQMQNQWQGPPAPPQGPPGFGPPPQHFYGGGDNQWMPPQEPMMNRGDVDLRHQGDHGGDVDLRQQMSGGGSWSQSQPNIPLDLSYNEGYDNYYNNPIPPQQSSQMNPRDPRTQRMSRNASGPSDMMTGGGGGGGRYSNVTSTDDYNDSSSHSMSRDPRSGANRYQQHQQQGGPSRVAERHDSKDDYSSMDENGSESGGRQPPNPKRKWKQDYEAEEAQEKQWQDDDDVMAPGGDVDFRHMSSRGRQRRRYN